MNAEESTAAGGSLDHLHDIVMPDAVSWWPLAPGWYVLFAIGIILTVVFVIRSILRYRRNAYRREALTMLLAASADPSLLSAEVAGLLKRTALSAYPREQVASLTGEDWLEFLDRTGSTQSFSRGAGRVLGGSQYGVVSLDESERAALRNVAGCWIRNHRTEGDG